MKKLSIDSFLRTSIRLLSILILYGLIGASCKQENPQPNILWISCEDITTMLSCYGDPNANTPNLDAFAKQGMRFTNAFATAPVCSPSRSCIVTGVYATSLGTQHLRSHTTINEVIKPFPKYLRDAGYFVTNNEKEDYNFSEEAIWNQSSDEAHWRNRKNNQPFFSVFNFGITHQSGIFGNDSVYEARIKPFTPHISRINPDSIKLLPYFPDTPGIRKLWARYYTNISIVDYQFQQILKQVKEDGLIENTIIFFFSDHGTGMPRSKRAVYDSGLKIPLLIYIPPKWQDEFNFLPGMLNEELVSFVDFAPTLLSIVGIDQPDFFQGQPFISNTQSPTKSFVFGASDRVDEAYEMSRTIRTKEFRYIRNFLPHLPLLQPNYYTDRSEIMRELNKVNKNELNIAQQTLFSPFRSTEELYNIQKDPNEIHNLITDTQYAGLIEEMRSLLDKKIIETHDTGLMPEPEMIRLSVGRTPYYLARDQREFPVEDILAACDLMLKKQIDPTEVLQFLKHPNGFVRYWTLITLQSIENEDKSIDLMVKEMLNDDFPTVQMEAVKLLSKKGLQPSLSILSKHLTGEDYIALYAARTYQNIGEDLHEIPKELVNAYEKLKIETNEGSLRTENYYKLYSYWALSETLSGLKTENLNK